MAAALELDNALLAFALTLFAGVSTGIGSALAFLPNVLIPLFSPLRWFSAGVMIYVSMIEIFVKAETALISELGPVVGRWVNVAVFLVGWH